MRVGIVGAGVSGLTTGRTLREYGHQVELFDKARGPGGRMATRRADGYMFDHGAQYFTARDPRFRQYVDDWIEQGLVALWKGQIGVRDAGILRRSESDLERFVAVPRMSALTRYLSDGLDVSYGAYVTSVQRRKGGWTIEVSDDRSGRFDAIVITTPPQQAVPLLGDTHTLATAAAAVRMAPCWAVMVVFEAALPTAFDGLFINEGPLTWAARNNSKPGRPGQESWVIHASPEWSRANIDLEREKVLDKLLPEFFVALQIDPIYPLNALAHRWRYALAQNPLGAACLSDPGRHLAVAGDWMYAGANDYAPVQAAFLSGLAAADFIEHL